MFINSRAGRTRIEEKSGYPQEVGEANSSVIIVEDSSSSVVLKSLSALTKTLHTQKEFKQETKEELRKTTLSDLDDEFLANPNEDACSKYSFFHPKS